VAVRYVKAVTFTLATAVLIVLLAVGFIYWRLTSGPIELAFLSRRIEAAMAEQFPGTNALVGKTVVEMDQDNGLPTIRFVNLILRDKTGNTIARIPKAGVDLDFSDWISGNVRPQSIDLFGARLNIVRTFEGRMELGISDAADAETSVDVSMAEGQSKGTGENAETEGSEQLRLTQRLMDVLKNANVVPQLASLREIRIRQAQIRFQDEANEADWFAPVADLTLSRADSGFYLEATASIQSSGAPWRARVNATYTNATGNVNVRAQVQDIIPADIAAKVYALSQFAKIESPLAGRIEADIDPQGNIARASAELVAGAGGLDLPNFIAQSIRIDSGTLKFAYAAGRPEVRIVDSQVVVNGAQASLSGSFEPVRDPSGKLTAVKIDLTSDNADNPDGSKKLIDRVSFKGSSSIETQEIDIEDLIVLNGETGVRLRGKVTGDETSPGIQMAGRIRDVNSDLLKALWPPIVTPNTRDWVQEHVETGRISEGTFQIDLAPGELATALRERRFEPGSIDLSMQLSDVRSRYFKGLSPIDKAFGTAQLKDNLFTLNIIRGEVKVGAETIQVNSGLFEARNHLIAEPPGVFQFKVTGTMQSLRGFLAQRDLTALNVNAGAIPAASGNVAARIHLDLPLIKNVPKERVRFMAGLTTTGVSYNGVTPGIDLSEGNFEIRFDEQKITVEGPAKLNGVASTINIERQRGSDQVSTIVKTTLDKNSQAKLGLDFSGFASGSVPIVVTSNSRSAAGSRVEADLSGVAMKVEALGWQRKPTPGTSMSLRVDDSGTAWTVKDLVISGPGVSIKGEIEFAQARKVKAFKFSEVQLGDEYKFAVNIEPGKDAMRISAKGNSFDARPFIKSITAPSRDTSNKPKVSATPVVLEAQIARVTANRGEVLKDVTIEASTGSGGSSQTAKISGSFLNGQKIDIISRPVGGGRQVQVKSNDGGATLRAANFYGKIAGGFLEFDATMANAPGSPVRNGRIVIRDFEVRNEAALAELDRRGKPKKSGPRRDGITFKRFEMPFSTDAGYYYFPQIELKGNEIGAVAKGDIRKSDGAIRITGTYIPAQGLTGWVDDVPLFGILLSGGRNEGLIGITFAMGGTITKPKYQINPLSALAPGFLRKFFEFQGPRRKEASSENKKKSAPNVLQ
jgi:hypothetical protein